MECGKFPSEDQDEKLRQKVEDDDEELRQKAGVWLLSMCNSGRASYDSDPKRIADYLQKEGNEKHNLKITTDIGFITEPIRITDAEIKEQSKLCRHNSSCSSSSTPVANLPIVAGDYPQPPPPPPGGGEELGRNPRVLFIKRELQRTDTRDHQNRLSMPRSQVNEEVLTAGEKARMEALEKIMVELIDPEGRRYDVNLKLTSAGKTSYSYTIGKPWNDIRRENGFRTGMAMNIWGFRGERGQLCFQLEIED